MKFVGGGDTGTLVKPNLSAPRGQIDTVSVVKIDDIIENKDQKILFTIDAEGSELDVLEGAISIISGKIKHYFIIELWDPLLSVVLGAKKNFSDVFRLMESKSYKGWKVDEGTGDVIEPMVNDPHTRNLSAVPVCFSNYLFMDANGSHEFLCNK